jgi:hypothetical protein
MVHKDDHQERLYQPGMDINSLTISFVLSRLDKKGIDHPLVMKNKDFERVTEILAKFDKLMNKSDSNIKIKDI